MFKNIHMITLQIRHTNLTQHTTRDSHDYINILVHLYFKDNVVPISKYNFSPKMWCL